MYQLRSIYLKTIGRAKSYDYPFRKFKHKIKNVYFIAEIARNIHERKKPEIGPAIRNQIFDKFMLNKKNWR
jgi:hypothetical protein